MEAIDFDSLTPHHSAPISDASSSLLTLSSAMIREVIDLLEEFMYQAKYNAMQKMHKIPYLFISLVSCP